MVGMKTYTRTTKSFMENFGLKYPIIQAPMAGVSTPRLAAKVTAIGGMGSLALGGNISNVDHIKNIINKYESELNFLTKDVNKGLIDNNNMKKINLNFFCHDQPLFDENEIDKWKFLYEKYFKEFYQLKDEKPNVNDLKIFQPYDTFKVIKSVDHPLIQFLVEYKPLMVSFHFGLPNIQIIDYLSEKGIKCFVSVTNISEFLYVRDNYENVKGFILQNYNAGGHRGNFIANDLNDSNLDLDELSWAINKAIEQDPNSNDLTIILAGGISTQDQINRIFSEPHFNASGVQLGSAFFLDESVNLNLKFKSTLLEIISNKEHNENYRSIVTPAISGRILRTFETPFIQKLVNDSKILEIPDYPLPYSIFKTLASKDKDNFGAFLIGANFRNIRNLNSDQLIKYLFSSFI